MFDPRIKVYGRRGKGHTLRDNSLLRNVKAAHLLAAVAWGGGALGMQALGFMRRSGNWPEAENLILACAYFIDSWVVMPGLIGCIITGLFYSCFTSIGFIKVAWIAYKWLISIAAAFWGTLFWTSYGVKLIEFFGDSLPGKFLIFMKICILSESSWAALLQLSIIFSMCLISVYRPLSFRFWIGNLHDENIRKRINSVQMSFKLYKAHTAQENRQLTKVYEDWLNEPARVHRELYTSFQDRSAKLKELEDKGLYARPFKKPHVPPDGNRQWSKRVERHV